MNKLTITFLIFSFLVGCGGGSGSDSNSSTTTTIESSTELVASNDFEFKTSREVTIDVDVSATKTSSALFSLCNDYTVNSDSSIDINHDSCLIKSNLNSGIYQTTLTLPNDITRLVSSIWFLDDISNPQVNEITVDTETTTITVR